MIERDADKLVRTLTVDYITARRLSDETLSLLQDEVVAVFEGLGLWVDSCSDIAWEEKR